MNIRIRKFCGSQKENLIDKLLNCRTELIDRSPGMKKVPIKLLVTAFLYPIMDRYNHSNPPQDLLNVADQEFIFNEAATQCTIVLTLKKPEQ